MFKNKKILILGAARSGLAAAKLLRHLNAEVVLNEFKAKEDIAEYQQLIDLGVKVIAGGHPKPLFEEEFDFVVKNPGIKYTLWFVERLNQRGIPIYTEIELAYQVSKKQHYIAVTGTNGKTTTVTLIYNIIKKQYPDTTHFAGNIGMPLCEVVLAYDLINQENHYIVLEMSNFQLLNIDQFKPEIATIINLTPDHLDYMRSVEEYYQSKTNIYINQSSEDLYINNLDDQTLQHYLSINKVVSKSINYSLDKKVDGYYIQDNYICEDNQKLLNIKDIKIVGKHNIQNCMLALIITRTLNIDLNIIIDTITSFKGVEHRIEFVNEINGVRYYNDSKATNVDATIIALKSFIQPTILLLGGFEKGLDVSEMKSYMKNTKHVIGYGACGHRLINDLKDTADCRYVETIDDAVMLAASLAVVGDVVVLSPTTSSYDQFNNFEERGNHFKSVVNNLNK